MYESNVLDLIDDQELAAVIKNISAEAEPESLINVAGSGYRRLGDQLTRGPEKGKFKLVPDTPTEYNEEEQDVLELLSLMKQYDFQMSGKRDRQPEQSFLKDKIKQVVKDKLTTSSVKTTGRGGTIGPRSQHPDLPAITDQVAQDATTKFIYSNLAGNEIGEQPITMIDKHGNRSSLPIEHTIEAFENNPSRGLDVDNRDLGSTMVNSVLRNETNTDRIAEMLYSKIADKAEYIDQTYGASYRDIMDEWDMDYQVGQRDWDPNKFVISEQGPGDVNVNVKRS